MKEEVTSVKRDVVSVKATLDSVNKGLSTLSKGVSFLFQTQGFMDPFHATLSGMLQTSSLPFLISNFIFRAI